MSLIRVERPLQRLSVRIPVGKDKPHAPSLLIPIRGLLSKKTLVDDHQLDELVRAALEKRGYTKEQVNNLMEKAEADFEYHEQVQKVRRILRQKMAERKEYSTLRFMQRGDKNWVLTSFPTTPSK